MVGGNRIRVLLAGNVHAKPTLVRRVLEDAGYEVVGEVTDPGQVLEAARIGRPDVVILDEELIARGIGLDALRRIAPDLRILVSTSAAPDGEAPLTDADGYLEKGTGLSALTALLGRLSAGPAPAREPVWAGRDDTEGSMSGGSMQDTQPIRSPGGGRSRAGAYRAAAVVVGLLLIVWGVVTAVTADRTPRGGTVAEETGPAEEGGVVEEVPTVSALDRAEESLDAMIAALRDGNYIFATVEAQNLMRYREQALAVGFSVSTFDAEVTARLEAVVPDLPQRVVTQLADILRSLFPVLEEPTRPGGGASLVLGTTVTTSGGGSGSSSGGGSGSSATGGTSGGTTSGSTGGSTSRTPQPGDGKVWGQWHKEHKGDGGPPPWAKAKGHDE